MPAYQIQVGGQLDGSTPFVLPSPLPAPADGGVIKLSTAISVGAIDLSALTAQTSSPVWVRSIHIELAEGTRACECRLSFRGTREDQLLTPVIAGSVDPLLMRAFTLNAGAIAPVGTTLRIDTDDVGPAFAGSPVAGPHFVYLDLVALDTDDEVATLVQAMEAQADLELYGLGSRFVSCQGAPASAEETAGIWRSPIAANVGANTPSGQLVRAEVAVGTSPAAGESMRFEVTRARAGVTESLGSLTVNASFAAGTTVDIPILLQNNEILSGSELRVIRTYTPGGAPAPMADTCVALRVAPVANGEEVGEEIPSSQTLRVTYPPSSWLGDADAPTWEGTFGGTAVGGWHPVTATHYLYLLQDDGTGRFIGVDPGPFEASLAGMTGVAIMIPSGNQDRIAVAAQVETDWNAAGTGILATALGDGRVTFVGAFDADAAAAAGPGAPWETRGVGTTSLGAQELSAAVGPNATAFRSACQILNSSLPSGPFRAVGFRVIGTNLQMAAAIDGDADGNPENGDVQVSALVPGGGSDWTNYWFTPSQVFGLDGSAIDRVWIVVDGDDPGSEVYGGNAQNLGWEFTGGNNVFRLGGNQGAAVPITTPLGPLSGGNFNFGLSMQLIVQVGPYYGNSAWRSYAGLPPYLNPSPLPNSVDMDQLFPAFGFDLPNVIELQIFELELNLATHDPAPDDQLRAEIWQAPGGGPLDPLTMVGDVIFQDLGPTTGSDTGWVQILSSAIDVDGGGQFRVSIKGQPLGPANDTSFGFILGTVADDVGRPAWFTGTSMADSEIEYLAANGETNIDFDPQVPTTSPINANSPPDFPMNTGGMALLIGHDGIVMEGNP